MEKGEMNTRNIIIAAVAVIGGLAAMSQFGTSTFGLTSSLNVAVIIGVAGVFVGKMLDARDDKSKGYVVKDELTLMVEGKASIIAFKFGNYMWLALLWYEFIADNWLPYPAIGSPAVMLVGLFVNLAIYFASFVYYRNRK
jgi:hypothetical protein